MTAADKSWSQSGDPVTVAAVTSQPRSGRAWGPKAKQTGSRTEPSEICPFHIKFGDEARRCLPCPCWKGKRQVFLIKEESPEVEQVSGNA